MSFAKYPAYKDSGVAWLGEVPSSWQFRPFWTLFRRTKRTGHVGEELLSVYRDHGVVPKASRDDNNNKPSDDLTPYQLVAPGDLAINKMKAWQGSVAISEHRGIVSPAYFVYEATHSENPKYLHYLFRSPRYITGYLSLSKGIRVNQWDLEPQDHSRMPVVLPPLVEQTAIATFLDHETARIDALVAEQERLIALLQEKRQAVISHAVTKGLNPHAPMKDSSVEWLGEVPGHWIVGKCGFYLQILSGFAFPSGGFSSDDSNHRLLRGVNVGVSRLKWDDVVYWQRTEGDGLDDYEMAEGDLVIGMDRPLIGEGMRIAKVAAEDLPSLLLQRVASLKVGGKLHTDYLHCSLASEMFVAHFSPETTGVSFPHISPDQIKNFVIPVPPIHEQIEIVNDVKKSLAKLGALITESETAITLLQERRTALISAAVTGQIDVRGWANAA